MWLFVPYISISSQSELAEAASISESSWQFQARERSAWSRVVRGRRMNAIGSVQHVASGLKSPERSSGAFQPIEAITAGADRAAVFPAGCDGPGPKKAFERLIGSRNIARDAAERRAHSGRKCFVVHGFGRRLVLVLLSGFAPLSQAHQLTLDQKVPMKHCRTRRQSS
jgi:hypothetical protein